VSNLPPQAERRTQAKGNNLLALIYDQLDAIRIMLQNLAWREETRGKRMEDIATLNISMSNTVYDDHTRILVLEKHHRDRLRFWLIVVIVLLGVMLGSAAGAWLWLRMSVANSAAEQATAAESRQM
jgi:hypothetical protein